MLPIQVVAIKSERQGDKISIKIGLSHKVRDFDKLDISVIANGSILPFTITPSKSALAPKHRNDITEVWQITVDSSPSLELSIA